MVLDNSCLQCPLDLSNTCGKGNIKLGSKLTSYPGNKAEEYILESVLLQMFFKSQYIYIFIFSLLILGCDESSLL